MYTATTSNYTLRHHRDNLKEVEKKFLDNQIAITLEIMGIQDLEERINLILNGDR